MASGTYFVRSCPTCGRNLEVRVELLGRDVECVHCGANFTATEESRNAADDLRIEQVLARAQRYIDSIDSLNSAPAE
jgi:DNA-directed RNA polymerase subunit RPC12/RpoP